MLQKHPDHRGLRKRFVNSVPDPRVFRTLKEFFPETGPIVAEHLDNPLLNIRLACGGGINGDISALRVAPRSDITGEFMPDDVQIRGPLCWDGTGVINAILKSSFQPIKVESVPRYAT